MRILALGDVTDPRAIDYLAARLWAFRKEKKIDLDNLTPEESLKLEIAAEIGVYDKVLTQGWRSLTAKESGRIGGMMTRRRREALKTKETEENR